MCTKAHVDTLALLTQTEVALKEHERVCRFGRRAPNHVYSSRVVPDIALRQRLSRWRYVKQKTRPEISWLTFVTAGRQKTNRERVGEYAPGQGKVLEAIRLEGKKGCVCVCVQHMQSTKNNFDRSAKSQRSSRWNWMRQSWALLCKH